MSLIRATEKAFFHISQSHFRKKLIVDPPIHVQIEPTVLCNLSCVTCTRENVIKSYKRTSLGPNDIDYILKLIPTLKSIKFQGLGEPLLTPNLDVILPKFECRRIRLWTITNGTVLQSSKHRLYLLSYFKDVGVSVDSTDSLKFEQLRKGGSLLLVKEGLKALISDRDRINSKLNIGINFCISIENHQEIKDIETFCYDLSIDYISFVFAENWYTSNEEGFANASLQSKMILEKEDSIMAEIRKLQLRLIKRGIIVGVKPRKPRLGRCHWPFKSFFISVEGEITPCCVRMHKTHSFGNIFEVNNLDEIWNSPGYQSLRQAHIESQQMNMLCGTCPT
jgi:radical SAM protein with 4Fe4S-binding SPASM domain